MTGIDIAQWILGFLLVASSFGVIIANKPVYASLSFLSSLLILAALFLLLSAQFVAIMQILVYAGAILVLFMFVIILFQDAYLQIGKFKARSNRWLLTIAGISWVLLLAGVGAVITQYPVSANPLPEGFGTVQSLGQALYIDFFFPFEAVIVIFLIAIVGALYIGRKVHS